ncbi:MBL fold metallo-hydrolase [Sphingomonas morindae]|uniref:MBL fold metallo-hydrolase n=1 Tax=Sphingomonas morindae TaxID=1541170 RepID=A0ABY4X6V6_9SPHN|nr:MBL fold metallo-hydrolase [Sphingomonas morindae]USI72648.1 MBL fold metallo-hydrolase [Sphingomonas morindae]
MRIRMLGSGTSSGVPRIGNDWGACDPNEPKNRRRRASIIVETDQTRILVDTTPDLREQLLDARASRFDAVIWTHDHADHTHGIDDLRQIVILNRAALEGYARPATLKSLQERFYYAFAGKDGYPPTVRAHELPDDFMIGDIRVRATDQPHGNIQSAGLRFDWNGYSAAYATDFNALTDEMAALYKGVHVWILDALRRKPHPTHPTVDQALGWIGRLKPDLAVLMHMDNSMDYRTLCAELPDHVRPGYDGMELDFA